jgi:hypothetical protein
MVVRGEPSWTPIPMQSPSGATARHETQRCGGAAGRFRGPRPPHTQKNTFSNNAPGRGDSARRRATGRAPLVAFTPVMQRVERHSAVLQVGAIEVVLFDEGRPAGRSGAMPTFGSDCGADSARTGRMRRRPALRPGSSVGMKAIASYLVTEQSTAQVHGTFQMAQGLRHLQAARRRPRSTSGVDVRHRARAVERRVVAVPTGMVAAAPQAGRSGRRAQS